MSSHLPSVIYTFHLPFFALLPLSLLPLRRQFVVRRYDFLFLLLVFFSPSLSLTLLIHLLLVGVLCPCPASNLQVLPCSFAVAFATVFAASAVVFTLAICLEVLVMSLTILYPLTPALQVR